MFSWEHGIIIVILVLILYIMIKHDKENVLARPTFFESVEDSYKGRIKDKKGLNYNDYLIEDQFLLDKYMTANDRILE